MAHAEVSSLFKQTMKSNISTYKLDKLGEFIQLDSNLYTDRMSWNEVFHCVKGCSNFMSNLYQLNHLAAKLLSTCISTHIPVLLTMAPWSLEMKDAAIARGNHPSAHAFDMQRKGIFVILP